MLKAVRHREKISSSGNMQLVKQLMLPRYDSCHSSLRVKIVRFVDNSFITPIVSWESVFLGLQVEQSNELKYLSTTKENTISQLTLGQ